VSLPAEHAEIAWFSYVGRVLRTRLGCADRPNIGAVPDARRVCCEPAPFEAFGERTLHSRALRAKYGKERGEKNSKKL